VRCGEARVYFGTAAMRVHQSSIMRVAVVGSERSVGAGEERRERIQGWWRAFEHAPVPRFATMHVTWQVRESSAGTIRQHIMQCD
jgi:hypothetical protein